MQFHISVFIEKSIKQPFWGKSEIFGTARATFPSPSLIWNSTVKNVYATVFFSLFWQQDLVDQIQLCACLLSLLDLVWNLAQ